VSKAGLVLAAATELDHPLLWHKIVCRRPPGTRSSGRPGFSHLLAFSRQARVPAQASSPDVLPELGEMPWSHSMVRGRLGGPGDHPPGLARHLLHPGALLRIGTVLALANQQG
jgi:hypothetical protein